MQYLSPWVAAALLSVPTVAPRDGDDEETAIDVETLLSEIEALRERLAELEATVARDRAEEPPDSGYIDLSDDEHLSLGDLLSDDVGARAWYDRITLSGFGAAGYLDSGSVGTQPDGSFFIDSAEIHIDAEIWENVSFFTEFWLTSFFYDYDGAPITGEVYARLRNPFGSEDGKGIGMKIGRFDVPFGEEYLWWDPNKNPLILHSAAQPYGKDEGVLVYGAAKGVDWTLAAMNGNAARSMDDQPGKAFALKLAGDPSDRLYLSASGLVTGDTGASGIRMSGQPLFPVGGGGFGSTLGASPSDAVDTILYQADAIAEPTERTSVALTYGHAELDDDVDAFDRDLTWFMVEPAYRLTDELFATARYSEYGTYDDDEGYLLDGKITAFGRGLGFDASRLQRLSVGLGWTPNPFTILKAEVGKDRFELIDVSPLDARNDDRLYVAFQIVVSF